VWGTILVLWRELSPESLIRYQKVALILTVLAGMNALTYTSADSPVEE
jgi:hypothetical protein